MGKFFLSRDFWIGLGLLIIFFSHYIIMGQDSVWYAQDYTELVIPWYKLLIDNNGLWKSNDYTIPGMLDYLPRASFASAFFLKTWLFFFFEPFQAVLLNKLLIHVLAYCSGYHLLDHFFYKKKPDSRIALFSLMWASIPFWPEAGIGLASYLPYF
ncbi:DUF6044 family protein [Algoriphagus boritolerans]|uniref:DUF6044 family protein n=1 Tax=Algoriphagus boritolerans TaxID=308111 RepID=UPI000A96741C